MEEDRQVTIAEAARLVSVHANTIRNWRAAGKLKSAHKALDGKKSVWLISLQEVTRLSYQHHNNDDTNPVVSTGYTSGYTTVNQADNNPAGAGSQSLARVDRPTPEYMALLEKLERVQEERRQEAITAAAKIATLEERLRALETSRAAPTSPPAGMTIETPIPGQIEPAAPLQAGISSPERRTGRGWWSRLLGGNK